MKKYIENRGVHESIAVFVLGLLLGAYSILGFFTAKVKAAWIMSPYLFPMLLSVFAVVVSTFLFAEAKKEAEQDTRRSDIHLNKVTVTAVMAAVYVALMPIAGFIVSTAVFLAVFMRYTGERKLKIIIPVSVVTPLALYTVFKMVLNVRLP